MGGAPSSKTLDDLAALDSAVWQLTVDLFSAWREAVGPDLPVIWYWDDGTDSPDEWADGPHLGVVRSGESDPWFVWPVHVEGWGDPAEIGWDGARRLHEAGKRT